MSFKCGIVGLPNVGKSTTFNALTKSKNAQIANFPFCTIDPNIGIVAIPDSRLEKIAKISNSKEKINSLITFVDIAGLVKGASKGEGLGNKFLSHIKEVDMIVHLVRCFDDSNIQNVNNTVDPLRDLEMIETELNLSDMESLEKRLDKKNKNKISNDEEKNFLSKIYKNLSEGLDLTNNIKSSDKKHTNLSSILSLKPKIIVCNVDEESLSNGNEYTQMVRKKDPNEKIIDICADIEDQLSGLNKNERESFMQDIGLD